MLISYNDNIYVAVHCKNILHSFRLDLSVNRLERQRKAANRQSSRIVENHYPSPLLFTPSNKFLYTLDD
jgi:hypothetical protein